MAMQWNDEFGYWYDDGTDDATDATSDLWNTYNPPTNDDYNNYDNYELKKFAERVANNTATTEEAKTLFDSLTGTAKDLFKKYIYNPDTNKINFAGIGTAMGAISAFTGGDKIIPAGYTKPIPNVTAIRAQIPYADDPNRRPGESGRNYFTPMGYSAPADAPAAQTAANTLAQGIAAATPQRPAQVNPYEGKFKTPWNEPKAMANGGLAAGGFVIPADVVAHFGNGSSSAGLALLAKKLHAKPIKGDGDGMSDSIPTHIDGKEKALVANDEAYISPEMVAKLGGANKLYAMMDKIRKARTGTKEQGKRINPEKFMPGGIAQLAGGGEIKRFAGDTTGSTVPTAGTSTSSSLSPWAGDYVTNMLGKAQGISNAPYQAYKGPLTAGASDLQNKAFAGASAIADAGYTPATFTNQYTAPGASTATQFTNQFTSPQAYDAAKFTTGTFGNQEAQQYMNPYLQQSLDPQIAEARRQYGITQASEAGKMTKSGAFGGSRQAILEAEGQRNLGTNLADITGKGYNTAYQQAMAQFNADQARQLQAQQGTEQSRQFGSSQGLTAAQAAAQYGQAAQAAQEQARQFGLGQEAQQAQLAAQYGQSAAEATEASRRASSEFGLKSLGELERLGATQRGIASEGIAADKAEFEAQRDYPAAMAKFQRDMITGLPLTTQQTTQNTTDMQNINNTIAGLQSLYERYKALLPS